jgi:predicted dehydrogenase
MKQLVQNLRTGASEVIDVPAPKVGWGFVGVEVAASVVSAGTERMIVEFAGKNLLQKARARPDLVRQVLNKLRRDGVASALRSVDARLDQPMPLGYAASGVVVITGDGTPFVEGDRVACAGAGYAVHAEIIAVPKNLVARVPDAVDDESAAFATLGAVALHGVRLADVKLGETVAVIGLGLLGQLTVQLLKAAGCRVACVDPDPKRSAIARDHGADIAVSDGDALVSAVQALTGSRGADSVLIAADTTSNGPIELAATVARDRAIVVAVGAVGMNIPRKAYFEKELDFRVARSYGPGRYDPEYELNGHDYPVGYVRWTQQRNFEAFLQLVGEKRVNVASLITHRLPIEEGVRALDVIAGKTTEPYLGVVLRYPGRAEPARRIELGPALLRPDARDTLNTGLLGAGLFAMTTLLPSISTDQTFRLRAVCAGTGLSAHAAARKFRIPVACTDEREVLADPSIDLVVIATRHSQHARQAIAALEAGKHVFVEKPPCLSVEELEALEKAWDRARASGTPRTLMAGFNRRWAPMIVELRKALEHVRHPLMIGYRVNAGYLPRSHWTQDPAEGGRLIGEGCHFIDLAVHLAASPVRLVTTRALPDSDRYSRDNFVVSLDFENGSIATITYLANGHPRAGKELLEVSGGGMTARLEDFRSLQIDRLGRSIGIRSRWDQDKGHRGEWTALSKWIRGNGPEPLPFDELRRTMRVVFAAADSLSAGGIPIDPSAG